MQPTSLQARVLEVPERFNLALLGGRGGGKSTNLIQLVLRHVVEHGEHAHPLLVRRTYPALRELEERLHEVFRTAFPSGFQYSRQEKIFRLPNGAQCELGQLEKVSDYQKYQGREVTLLVVDEVTLFANQRVLRLLRSNLRSPHGVPLRTVIAGNPGGPGHVEVARRHVNSRAPWQPYEIEPGDWWITVPSVLDDNPHLDHDAYEVQLRAACAGDEALFNAYRCNDWEAIAGAFFQGHWGPHLLVADDGWTPGKDWSTYWSFDYGMSAPGVALGCARATRHGAVGPNGVAYPRGSIVVVTEVHSASADDPSRGLEWPIDRWGDELKDAGDAHAIRQSGVADDARGLGADETVISELKRHGLTFSKPNKGSRVGGWTKLKSMMRAAKRRDPDEPWLHLVATQCPYTCETMPVLPRDPRRIEDADTTACDHAADALRYAVTSEGLCDYQRALMLCTW